MGKRSERQIKVQGAQLIERGEIVRVMEGGAEIKCRVLSCIATEGGACLANLEIVGGEQTGRKFEAVLRASPVRHAKPGSDPSDFSPSTS